MITFGQRLKALRKNMEMSQAELSEKLCVSVQTLSRWECDAGMPDIVQIIPLAKILGVTCDILLGMDSKEEEDILSLEKSLAGSWRTTTFNNNRDGEKYEEVIYDSYKKYRELYKRYPTNYDLALECAGCAGETLTMAKIFNRLTLDEKEERAIFADSERMLRTVMKYDDNFARRLRAKQLMIGLYCSVKNFGKAEAECEDLDRTQEIVAKIDIANARDDDEDRTDKIALAKRLFHIRKDQLFGSLYTLGRAYSIFGKEKRAEALEVYNLSLSLVDALKDSQTSLSAAAYESGLCMLIAKEYLREGDFDSCLDYVEKTTDACIKYLGEIKKKLTTPSPDTTFLEAARPDEKSADEIGEILSDKRESLKWTIIACWEECGNEDNVITRSERYKKCIEKYGRETDLILNGQ